MVAWMWYITEKTLVNELVGDRKDTFGGCKCKLAQCKCQCCTPTLLYICLLGGTLFLLLGLAATTTCYFVFVPINKSISDAPGRVLSIYQSGGFLIGSFFVYKVTRYFYSKKDEDNKVKVILDGTLKNMNINLQGISDSTTGGEAPDKGTNAAKVDTKYRIVAITMESEEETSGKTGLRGSK